MSKKITGKDIKNYVQGNVNLMKDSLGLLPEHIQDQVKARQKICEACPLLAATKDSCTACGCTYPDLTFSPKKECPTEKWGVMNIEPKKE
jgi:hypothetical protein